MSTRAASTKKTPETSSKTATNETKESVKDVVKKPSSMPLGTRYAYLLILSTSVLAFFHLMPVSIHMLLITFATIYIGSVNSVKNHADDSVQTEQMQTKDVYMFPVIGSCVLFSLYLVFKFLPVQYVNLVIKAYFFIFGIGVLTNKLSSILSTLLTPTVYDKMSIQLCKIKNPLFVIENGINKLLALFSKPEKTDKSEKQNDQTNKDKKAAQETPSHLFLTPLDLTAFLISVTVALIYLKTNNWFTSNVFGIAFSVQGIELLSLGSYMNGAILLSGLFFYDIFWVFGTDVMVTVAKSFDAPIKLLFPQASYMLKEGDKNNASMLGLGDIVIPGIFIALLLRYDYAQYKLKNGLAQKRRPSHSMPHVHLHLHSTEPDLTDVPKPFFYSNLVAYLLGLTMTVQVMYWFQAAQPALLYLVPACLGASLITAAMRNELKTLLKFSESEGEETGEKEGKKAQ